MNPPGHLTGQRRGQRGGDLLEAFFVRNATERPGRLPLLHRPVRYRQPKVATRTIPPASPMAIIEMPSQKRSFGERGGCRSVSA